MSDQTQRFLFDDNDVRGETATLAESYQHVLAKHAYPEPVAQLLGELLAAAALLVGTLKFDGLLSLQARSDGPVPLLMVECSSDREVRGIARYHAEQIAPDATLRELMPEGMLAITVEPAKGQRYQGIVGLEGVDLAACLSEYFAASEQLPTRFWLAADSRRACGLLLQQLPPTAFTIRKSAKPAGSTCAPWPIRSAPRNCWGWIPRRCCIGSTTRNRCGCSRRSRSASAAVARASARPMRWSAWASTMPNSCCRSRAAPSPWIASSATNGTSSMPPTSASCSPVVAPSRPRIPVTDGAMPQ